MIGDKALDAVSKADIEDLIANQVREQRKIEYKLTLPGGTDRDKKEFLADVSSFANAGGGDLVYGIEEKEGIPQKAVGVAGNPDEQILRLEIIIRTGIEPRVPGVKTHPIEGFDQGPVIIIRIPRSWNSPHMVTYQNTSRFYTRSSSGKYQMNTTEIRSAFLLSDTLPQKIRQFRDDRLSKIIAGETPVPLLPNEKLIVHVLPMASFSSGLSLDLSGQSNFADNLNRFRSLYINNWRFNLDGFIAFGDPGSGSSAGYLQIFRTGQTELVDADLMNDNKIIEGFHLECRLVSIVKDGLAKLNELDVTGPIIILAGMIGVKGFRVKRNQPFWEKHAFPIDRDTLIFPEIIFENYPPLSGNDKSDLNELAKSLRPMLDTIWNAGGYARPYNFDDQGEWRPR